MSLFIPEWIGGYETFLDVAEEIWNPFILCMIDPEDEQHFLCTSSFFNVDGLNTLIDFLGENVGKKFAERVTKTTNLLQQDIQLQDFIKATIPNAYLECGPDSEKCTLYMVHKNCK